MSNFYKTNKTDLIGILSSSICLVHCIATPLLIALGAGFITNPIFKYLFLFLSFVTIFKVTEKHTHFKIALLLWTAFLGFSFSTIFEDKFYWLHYLEYFFSVLIIVGHILNINHCKQCTNHNQGDNEI